MFALVAFFVGCAEVAYDDEIIDERVASGESSTNAIDLPKVAKPTPQIATKPKQKTKPTTKSNVKSTNSKSAQLTQKSTNRIKDSQKLLDSPTTKAQTPSDSPNLAIDSPNVPTIQPKNLADSAHLADSQNPQDSIDDSAHSQDSANLTTQNPSDSRILNKSAPKVKSFFDASKLNQPLPQLQTQCDSRDLQKCEDLGRIYAVQEKIDLATAHYKIACAKGKGRVMSCFFNSLIFANNGDDATASEYLSAISSDTLSALKIDEAELMLSIGEIALIKDKLKISCASGESTSCNALLSVFKIRGELSQARTFFSAECSRSKKQNATPCVILKNL